MLKINIIKTNYFSRLGVVGYYPNFFFVGISNLVERLRALVFFHDIVGIFTSLTYRVVFRQVFF